MKSRLVAGAAAVVLALVGAMLVINYAQGADQRAVKDLEPVDVLVVTTAIPAGTPVESMSASLTTKQVPESAVTGSSLKSLDSFKGKVAGVALVPGEQLVAERLVAPQELKVSGAVKVPAGLQEVTFRLEPDRVVGGRLTAGDHVGIFVSLTENKPETEKTKLTVRKVLLTAVQRAPEAAATTEPTPSATATADPQDTTLPTGSLMLTVAVDDVAAAKIVFAAEYGKIWLSKEPLDAKDNGPRIIDRAEVYK